MKKLTILTMAALLCCMTACDKDRNEPNNPSSSTETSSSNQPSTPKTTDGKEPYLKITNGTADRTISYNGGYYDVKIESNTEWTCNCGSYGALEMQLNKKKGYGNDVVRVLYNNTSFVKYSNDIICVFKVWWKNSSNVSKYVEINFVRRHNK